MKKHLENFIRYKNKNISHEIKPIKPKNTKKTNRFNF